MTFKDISTDQLFDLYKELEQFNGVFYTLVEAGEPRFVVDSPYKTAAVLFERDTGRFVDFVFNEDFWYELDCPYSRAFITCHEALHILLDHGIRIAETPSTHANLFNIALDLTINHLLVNRMGFDRDRIVGWENLCWVDTVFKHDPPPTYLSFEEYLREMLDRPDDLNQVESPDHSHLPPMPIEEMAGGGEFIERIQESVSQSDLDGVGEMAGDGALGKELTINAILKKKSKKWESVIHDWVRRNTKARTYKLESTWTRRDRRHTMLNSSFMLPSTRKVWEPEPDKVRVWFFQDASGSCIKWASRFFASSQTIPEDRFDVRLFSFDRKVYDIDPDTLTVKGGGGTCFQCIKHAVETASEEEKPDAVFILTDGYAGPVHFEEPEKVHWFLSTSCRTAIQKNCHVHKLSDYE